MPNVQIRDVPEDVHRVLKSKAALSGRSLNGYLLSQMEMLARTESIAEFIARHPPDPEAPSGAEVAALIRKGREGR